MISEAFTPTSNGFDLTLEDLEHAEYALALRVSFHDGPDNEAVRRARLRFLRLRQSASHYPERPIRVFLTKPVPTDGSDGAD